MLARTPCSWAGDVPDEPEVLRPRCVSADAVLCHLRARKEERSRRDTSQGEVSPTAWRPWPSSAARGAVDRCAGAGASRPEAESSIACREQARSIPSRGTDLLALYRAQVDTYTARLQDDDPRASHSPRQTLPQRAPAPAPELVECDDGAVRPAIGLCFAFVAATEKLDLMLTSADGQCAEGLLQTRRRESLEGAAPMIEMDSPGTQSLDCEVQRIVAQRRAPKPKKMPKPTKLRQPNS